MSNPNPTKPQETTFVIVAGYATCDCKLWGPFESHTIAHEWADQEIRDVPWISVEVETPEGERLFQPAMARRPVSGKYGVSPTPVKQSAFGEVEVLGTTCPRCGNPDPDAECAMGHCNCAHDWNDDDYCSKCGADGRA